MTCDSDRPCSRCVKRNIGHLCHDEVKEHKSKSPKKEPDNVPLAQTQNPQSQLESQTQSSVSASQMRPPTISKAMAPSSPAQTQNRTLPQSQFNTAQSMMYSNGKRSAPLVPKFQEHSPAVTKDQPAAHSSSSCNVPAIDNHFINEFSSFYDTTLGLPPESMSHFASEHTNSEFLVLSDFLNIIGPPNGATPNSPNPGPTFPYPGFAQLPEIPEDHLSNEQKMALRASSMKYTKDASIPQSRVPSNNPSRVPSRRPSFGGLVSSGANDTTNLHEKFFLTAADPVPDSAEERLKQVINAKVEAGLMKPFDYVRGYARLQKYMDINMSPDSRARILAPLSTFRPAFRAIAKKLTDVDLILVEEAFERLLLDYDRVFTSMAVPACLWRRTGEIFRGNKEFAALLNLPVDSLRDGKLAITELMAEDSAVNYWEKYGSIAFDGQQKAVLTSCLLQVPGDSKGAIVSCCFSFTIKRDRYNIPSCIVGNFIPISF